MTVERAHRRDAETRSRRGTPARTLPAGRQARPGKDNGVVVVGSATQWSLAIVAASARAGRGEEDAAEGSEDKLIAGLVARPTDLSVEYMELVRESENLRSAAPLVRLRTRRSSRDRNENRGGPGP